MGEHRADDRWRIPRPSEVRKALVALAGFGAIAVSTILAVGPELIPAQYLPWVHVALGVASLCGVYGVRNAPAPKPTPRE